MGRIAWEIANKIASLVNVRSIFRESITGSIKLISESQAVLLKWEKAYMEMRQRIEESGRDNRCVARTGLAHTVRDRASKVALLFCMFSFRNCRQVGV